MDTAPSGVETNTETTHICNPSVPGTEINIDHSPHVIVLSQQESSSTAAVSLILSTSLKDCKHTGHLQESPRILVEIIALDEDEECSPLPGESFMVEVAESWRCDEAGSTVNFEDAEHYEGGIPAVSDARSKEHAPAIDCDSEAGSTTMTHNQVIDGSSGDAVDQAMEMLRGNLRDRDNEIKRLQSLVKAVQESHDDDKADKLEDLRLKIQQVQSQPQTIDIRLQNIAHLVLQLNEQPNGVTSVTSKTGTIRAYTEYLKLPKHRSCGHTSTRQSQRDYVLRKARLVAEYIELIVDENSRAGVVEKMAELRDYVVLKKDQMQLSIQDCVVLRDFIGCSSNGMYRLKSGLAALNLYLSHIIPSCIKHRFAMFEGTGNLKVDVVQHQLIVTQDDTKHKSLPFSYLLHPWQRVEQMVEKSKSEGTYQASQEWSSLENCSIFTVNIDKGGSDIQAFIRYANKESVNSMKDTSILASVGGPVSECLQN